MQANWTRYHEDYQLAPPGCPVAATHEIFIEGNWTTVGNCSWSHDEILTFCIIYEFYDYCASAVPSISYPISQLVLTPLGLFCNISLFLTLLSPLMTGTTFRFLRVIAVLQVLQTFCSIFTAKSIDGTIFDQNALAGHIPYFSAQMLSMIIFPSFIAMLKLMTCSLCFFLTLERFLAVRFAQKYSSMNYSRFFKIAVIISLIISCIEILRLFSASWISGCGGFICLNGLYYYFFRYVKPLSIATKLLIIIGIISFSFLIIQSLRAHSQKMQKMISTTDSHEKFKETVQLCRFQLIDATFTIFEAILWSVSSDIGVFYLGSLSTDVDDRPCDFAHWTWRVSGVTADIILGAISNMTQALSHGELFIVYVIISKKFRNALYGMCKKATGKMASMVKNGSTAGPTVVQVLPANPMSGSTPARSF